eukprot:4383581-Lingulodinium_polyedra.AAC.1
MPGPLLPPGPECPGGARGPEGTPEAVAEGTAPRQLAAAGGAALRAVEPATAPMRPLMPGTKYA